MNKISEMIANGKKIQGLDVFVKTDISGQEDKDNIRHIFLASTVKGIAPDDDGCGLSITLTPKEPNVGVDFCVSPCRIYADMEEAKEKIGKETNFANANKHFRSIGRYGTVHMRRSSTIKLFKSLNEKQQKVVIQESVDLYGVNVLEDKKQFTSGKVKGICQLCIQLKYNLTDEEVENLYAYGWR